MKAGLDAQLAKRMNETHVSFDEVTRMMDRVPGLREAVALWFDGALIMVWNSESGALRFVKPCPPDGDTLSPT